MNRDVLIQCRMRETEGTQGWPQGFWLECLVNDVVFTKMGSNMRGAVFLMFYVDLISPLPPSFCLKP